MTTHPTTRRTPIRKVAAAVLLAFISVASLNVAAAEATDGREPGATPGTPVQQTQHATRVSFSRGGFDATGTWQAGGLVYTSTSTDDHGCSEQSGSSGDVLSQAADLLAPPSRCDRDRLPSAPSPGELRIAPFSTGGYCFTSCFKISPPQQESYNPFPDLCRVLFCG